MNTQRLTLITAVVLVLAGLGIFLATRNNAQGGTTTAQSSFDGTINLEGQPSIGDEAATVNVVVFEDIKCPACRNFEETVFPQLERDYIRTGKIKFHFINFAIPLGPDSITAAIAVECAFEQNEEAFWEYKTILYRSQGSESQQWANPDKLAELAQTYVPDLNSEELKTCVEERRFEQRVADDRALGMAAGVQGTPSVFVNNQAVTDARYATIQVAIDAALAQ